KLVSSVADEPFLQKFRNGFATLLSEVGKLEKITPELINNTSKARDTTYYSDAIKLLNNSGTIHVSVPNSEASYLLIDLHIPRRMSCSLFITPPLSNRLRLIQSRIACLVVEKSLSNLRRTQSC